MALINSLVEFDVCTGVEVDVDAPMVVVAGIGTTVSGTMENYVAFSFSFRSLSSSISMFLIQLFNSMTILNISYFFFSFSPSSLACGSYVVGIFNCFSRLLCQDPFSSEFLQLP